MSTTVKFPNDILFTVLMDWLDRIEPETYVYIFPFREITFFHKADALAFMIAFGGKQKITKIESMIEQADD